MAVRVDCFTSSLEQSVSEFDDLPLFVEQNVEHHVVLVLGGQLWVCVVNAVQLVASPRLRRSGVELERPPEICCRLAQIEVCTFAPTLCAHLLDWALEKEAI